MLGAQRALLGGFPQWMLQHDPIAQMFFTQNGEAYEVNPPGLIEGVYLLLPAPDSSLTSMIEACVDTARFGGDLTGFITFLRALLTLDPFQRPTAAAALEHPWLATYRTTAHA